MGTGTDVAIESAGVTLIKGDLSAIARARTLSAATMRNIRQNLFFAFIYNALGVPVAAGVLYPAFGLLWSPIIAAGGDGPELGLGGRQPHSCSMLSIRRQPTREDGLASSRALPRLGPVLQPGVRQP